jgi:hypothetical protein
VFACRYRPPRGHSDASVAAGDGRAAQIFYRALGGWGGAVSREAAQGGELTGLPLVTVGMRRIRLALLGCAFFLLPAVGFALGSAFGSDAGSVQ